MKVRSIDSLRLFNQSRVDSGYYLAPGVAARDRVQAASDSGVTCSTINDLADGKVWQPHRFRRAYAAPGESSVPYLRPYDTFEYLPQPADLLSAGRTEQIDDYRLKAGWLLQSCSGRNLGPLTVVDKYLEDFVLSHDMVRIELDDDHRAYVYAFLASVSGQSMLRQGKSGSVIDHLTTADVADLTVPIFDGETFEYSSAQAKLSLELVAEARRELADVCQEFALRYPYDPVTRRTREGWSIQASQLTGRVDAAYYSPAARSARAQVQQSGGQRLAEVAEAILPGRYKRYYVEAGHGRPIISGRQLLQFEPINLQHIANRSFRDPDSMVLEEGMVCFGADGRWEERLGQPAYITPDRTGWLASNHVLRLRAADGVDPGWLWLAVGSRQVQVQLEALPHGSVVDAVGPADVGELLLPPVDNELGLVARQAWNRFTAARAARAEAVRAIEQRLDEYADVQAVPA